LLVYSLTHEMDVALHGVATALAEQAQRQTTAAFVPSDVDAIFQRFVASFPGNASSRCVIRLAAVRFGNRRHVPDSCL
jgi:hypothetical protein